METNLTIKQIEDVYSALNSNRGNRKMDIDEIRSEIDYRSELLSELQDAKYNLRTWLKLIQNGLKKEISEGQYANTDYYKSCNKALDEIPQFFATLLYFSESINEWNNECYNLLKFINEKTGFAS